MVWWYVIVWIATIIIGELLRPKPKFDTPQPSALGDFQVPTAEEGRAIPVIFGTCHVKGPNVTWYGDLKVVPITEKVKTGLFSSKRITKGYKYYLGMQLSLCHGPIDAIIECRWGDRIAEFTSGAIDSGNGFRFTFDDTDLYGGEDREGGISGAMDIYLGTTTQTANDYLDSATGVPNPGYRTVCHAVMRQMYIGNSQYIKQNSFVLRRCPNQLGLTDGKHNINGDANPACVIYEVLTNKQWGCGFDPSQIDTAAFTAVGNTLFDEGLGVSFQVQATSSAGELLREILRHLDGVVFADPETGLLTLKLARADYDVEDLDVLDESNCEECEFSRGSWTETINTIRVLITDRSQDYTERPVPAQNLANIQARNGFIEPEDYAFKMISNTATGQKIASRVLKTVSYPVARAQMTANRKAWKFRPGSVVRMSWARFGITALVVRITNIDYGEYKDGKIRIDLVEDIFHTPYNAFDPPSGTGWVRPTMAPAQNTTIKKLEVPWFVLSNSMEASAVQALTPTDSFIFLLVQPPASQNHAFNVYEAPANVLAQYENIGQDLYTPTASLDGGIAWDTASFNIDGFLGTLDDVIAGEVISLVLVDDEWMLVNTIDLETGAINVKRGVLDTLPVLHADNARMWLYFGTTGFAGIEHPSIKSATRWYRETGVSIDGESDLSGALTQSHVHDADWYRPYPPADVKVFGQYFPASIPGTFTITWKGRNRLAQIAPKGWTEAHEAPESGQTYTLRVYDDDTSTLLSEVTGLGMTGTGGSYTYPGQDAVVGTYRIELEASRGGLASRQKFSHVATIFGYGLNYGEDYGGSILGVVLPRGTSSVNTGEQYKRVPVPIWINGNWHDFESRHPMLSVNGGENWVTEAIQTSSAAAGPPTSLFGTVQYAYGNGVYVAWNRSGTYWVRRDGGLWTQMTQSSTTLNGAGNISTITFDGTRFLAAMGNHSVYASLDPTLGSSWSQLASNPFGTGHTLLIALKIGSQYVAHTSQGGSLWAWTSANAVTWTQNMTPIETGVSRIFWFGFTGHYFNGAYFVFGAEGPTIDTRVLYGYRSTDGITWAQLSLPSAGSGTNWHGTWVLQSKMLVSGGDYVWSSTNGTTWTRDGVSKYAIARSGSSYFRAKGDQFATENGPPSLLIYVSYYVEDGGKLVTLTDLTASATLRHPTDGSVLNSFRFGALSPIVQNGSNIQPTYENSGFRVRERTGDQYYGRAIQARMTGKRYFEVKVEELPYGVNDPILTLQIGVQRVLPSSTAGGFDPPIVACVFANGFEYLPSIGDIVGVLVDLDAGNVEIRVNNVLFKSLSGLSTGYSYIPVFNSPRATVLADMGPAGVGSTFTYAPPGGYVAWES